MKTRSKEYSFPSVAERSAVKRSSGSTKKTSCGTMFTFISDDSSVSSLDYELTIEPEKKEKNYSDTEEFYRDLIEKVKLKFMETKEDADREHRDENLVECETLPKSLETDALMEDADEANFSKFQDGINSMSTSVFNATSTPLPSSSMSINDLHFENKPNVSVTKLFEPQEVSPVETPSDIPFNSDHNISMIISNESSHSHSDNIELYHERFDGNVNIQSEGSSCNVSLDTDKSQCVDEISAATSEESNELIIQRSDKTDDDNDYEKNYNDSNFSNKHISNTDRGVDAPVRNVETMSTNIFDASDSMCNAKFLPSSMSVNIELHKISDFNEANSPTVSLENILSDIQCRSGYKSPTRASKDSVRNPSNEMEIRTVPFIGNVNIQLDEIEEHENSIVKEKSSKESRRHHVVVEEHEITTTESEELNEVNKEGKILTAGSEELIDVINDQSSNCEGVNEEEKITTAESEELNEAVNEQPSNSSNCEDVKEEEEIITAESEELNEVINEQPSNSSNCEDVKEQEEMTTAESEELNEAVNEQPSNCEDVKEEEEITTAESEELNEVINEQPSNCEDVEDSVESDDISNSTIKHISSTNVEVLDEKVRTLLKRKLDVAVQTMPPSESVCKRTKMLEHLKKNFFEGDLCVYSLNRIL